MRSERIIEEIQKRKSALNDIMFFAPVVDHLEYLEAAFIDINNRLNLFFAPFYLSEIRAELKKSLGSWDDKVVQIYNAGGDELRVVYRSERHPIELLVKENVSTIDLKAYGMEHCELAKVETAPRSEWTVLCPAKKGA